MGVGDWGMEPPIQRPEKSLVFFSFLVPIHNTTVRATYSVRVRVQYYRSRNFHENFFFAKLLSTEAMHLWKWRGFTDWTILQFVWRNISAWAESCRKICFYIFFLLYKEFYGCQYFFYIPAMLLVWKIQKRTGNNFSPIEEMLFNIWIFTTNKGTDRPD